MRSGPGRPDGLRTYRVFGVNLASALPFRSLLGIADGAEELSFAVSPVPIVTGSWKGGDPIFRSPRRFQNGESFSQLYQLNLWEALCFPGVADFYLQGDRIAAHPIGNPTSDLLEIRLLGPVLSYWLERQGFPTLHASAVAVDGRAVAFLSSHGSGKTGLAAAMMRAGLSLLTDDILPVEERDGKFLGRPGYSQMRMWPDEAEHFLGKSDDLPLVHPAITKRVVTVGGGSFGAFHDMAVPLACIYLPERVLGGPIEIHEISRREALIELVRHSFSRHLVQAVGFQPRRLDLFARLVMQVPVRRLRYPSGFERLPEVVERLLKD